MSGHWWLQVRVMKRSVYWYSHELASALRSIIQIIIIILISIIAFWRCFLRYLELQMKDGGWMTFFPDLMSSALLTVVIFSQTTTWEISDQEAICQFAAGIGIGQFWSFWWRRRQWRLNKGLLFSLKLLWNEIWILLGWLAESVYSLQPESESFLRMVVAIM